MCVFVYNVSASVLSVLVFATVFVSVTVDVASAASHVSTVTEK